MMEYTFDLALSKPEINPFHDNAYIEDEFTRYSIGSEGVVETWFMSVSGLVNICKSFFTHYRTGYCINSFMDFDGTWFAKVSGQIPKGSFSGETEAEAVFSACEWIMDYENSNDKIEKDAEITELYRGFSGM